MITICLLAVGEYASFHCTLMPVGRVLHKEQLRRIYGMAHMICGCSYFAIDSYEHWRAKLRARFDQLISPLVYNLRCEVHKSEFQIKHVHGFDDVASPAINGNAIGRGKLHYERGEITRRRQSAQGSQLDRNDGEFLRLATVFCDPSVGEGEEDPGNIFLLELEHRYPDFSREKREKTIKSTRCLPKCLVGRDSSEQIEAAAPYTPREASLFDGSFTFVCRSLFVSS